MSAVPADPDTLSFFPGTDTGSRLVDDAGDFMAGYPGKRNYGKEAFFDKRIAVANPTGLDFHADLIRTGGRDLPIHDFKFTPRLADQYCFHFEKGRIPPMQFLMRAGHFFYLAF